MAAIGRARRRKTRTLKGAVVGFAIVLAVMAWAVVLLVTDADQEQQLRQAENRASNAALVFEERLYRQFLSVDQILRGIKMDWEHNPAGFDYASLQRRILSASDAISQVLMIDAHGRVVATAPRDLADTDFSARRYFQAHRSDSSTGLSITGPFQLNGSWSLSFSRRLNLDHGVFGGVVAAAYDLNGLARDLSQSELGPRSIVMLVGRDGLVRAISLLGVREPGADIKNTGLYRAIFEGSAQSWTGPSGPDRDVRIHAWREIPGQDLFLVVGLDRNTALDGAEARRWGALGATATVTLVMLVLAGGVAATISSAASREQRLAQDREVLEAANLRLAKARERADEKSLQLETTLAGMSDGISMFDGALGLVQWNDQYAELNGLPPAVLRVGISLAEILRIQTSVGEFGPACGEHEIAAQLRQIQDRTQPTTSVRQRPSGRVVEMRRTRLPDGGLVTLYTDITARKQMEDAQSRAREQVEIAAQEKSRFVAIVSHEIRTPLNVALNALNLLDRTSLAPAQRQLVGAGLMASESLMALLNDILDLSRMQVGQLQLRPAPFTLRPMLDGIVDLFRHQAEERGVELSVVVAPGVPERLMTDASRLRQALLNLVNNAAKFANPGPASLRVSLTTLKGEPVLRFAVRDGGPDIPDLDRARLFRPFSQLQHPGDTGTGLGLAICQLLANLLGGHIGCDNLQAGKEFWLTVPADVMDVPDEPVPVVELEPGWLPRTRILLVEDVPANQFVIATGLRRKGHMVDLASSGLEALQRLDGAPYDVVLLDIFMPGIDGLETARRIRALPTPARHTPLVALTANVSVEDRAAYLEAGMDDLVAKPVETAMLLRSLAQHVWPGRRAALAPPQAYHVLADAVPEPAKDAIDHERVQSWMSGLRAAVAEALFADCLRQLRVMVAALHTALDLHHTAAIRQATHAMQGVAGNYGLSALEATIRAIALDPEARTPDRQADLVNQEIDRAEHAVAFLLQGEVA